MKLSWALVGLAACVTSMPVLAQSDVSELERRVLSGELTPQDAISGYCGGDTRDKTQDAFCSCPEEALRLLERRLKIHRMDEAS